MDEAKTTGSIICILLLSAVFPCMSVCMRRPVLHTCNTLLKVYLITDSVSEGYKYSCALKAVQVMHTPHTNEYSHTEALHSAA